MRSRFVGAFVLMLTVSFASVCFAATDFCKEYAVNGEFDKAIEECTRQIKGEIAVRYLEYSYSNRGAAYASKKQYEKAISDYDKAIELNPGYATAYYNRAVAYASKKQYDLAISDYNKVIELSPEDSIAYIGRETAYANKKHYDQAVSDNKKAIVSLPISSPAAQQATSPSASPADPTSLPSAKPAGKTIYYVQLGVFKNENKAAALTKRFNKKGYDAFVMKSSAKDKRTFYRVLIGTFEDKQKTAKLAAEIKRKEKITPIIFSE